ncbi:hypothetical protein HQ42_07305 [Porphyromonas gulae]|uniref:hypothetical protein n=1 Tax=Porphyromonas TaxID=836 RepID=UPI00051E0779|nr:MULTISPECIES: hypothetical protein [Porphyromonas]KGL54158.1 hypothetical protein HQ50_10385 [Porphyromonas sp. COT-052 OH4946]KGO02385.1 hypothetical protein HQ42_07305 [Porphyromonas gulae]
MFGLCKSAEQALKSTSKGVVYSGKDLLLFYLVRWIPIFFCFGLLLYGVCFRKEDLQKYIYPAISSLNTFLGFSMPLFLTLFFGLQGQVSLKLKEIRHNQNMTPEQKEALEQNYRQIVKIVSYILFGAVVAVVVLLFSFIGFLFESSYALYFQILYLWLMLSILWHFFFCVGCICVRYWIIVDDEVDVS